MHLGRDVQHPTCRFPLLKTAVMESDVKKKRKKKKELQTFDLRQEDAEDSQVKR